MNILTIEWTIEAKNILFSLLKNPILYWVILLSFVVAKRRKVREILQFNKQITTRSTEWKKTFGLSVFCGLVISFITLTFGFVLTYEVVLILSIITFLISYVYHYKFLSVSFTFSITYLLLFKSIQNHYENSIVIFTSLTVLIGVFLIIEAILLRNFKNEDSAPELTLTERGATFGQLHLNKISLIPFLIFVPSGSFTALFPVLPEVTINGEDYNIVLIPLFIGFNFLATKKLPNNIAKRNANRVAILGALILLLSIVAYYLPSLSIVVVLIALIGRSVIQITSDMWSATTARQFTSATSAVKVFWIMEDSPAENLGLEIGDTILKVNKQSVQSVEAFYACLNDKDIVYELEVIDANNAPKAVQATVITSHQSELGLILI